MRYRGIEEEQECLLADILGLNIRIRRGLFGPQNGDIADLTAQPYARQRPM